MSHQCYDFVADCQIRLATDLLTHTWDPVILSTLRRGTSRRRDIIEQIGGISDKALTQSLSRLMERGLVTRSEASGSRNVAYLLTELGTTFVMGPLLALGTWAVEHGEELMAARNDM